MKATAEDLEEFKRKYPKQFNCIVLERQENVVPSDGASPPMVELGSKFENTKE